MAAAARTRIEMMAPQLIGQDPLTIERHFYMMAATQYSFMANIPTVSGVDIALWISPGRFRRWHKYAVFCKISAPTNGND